MKARVKETGDIIEISEDCSYIYAENYDKAYNLNELEFLDVKEKSLPKDEPDYWEKLKHQYAGMAMQGILSNKELFNTITDGVWPPNKYVYIAERCDKYATALVNRLKEDKS